MGDIANDMVMGRCCAICGQYFEEPEHKGWIYEHGCPVACHDCWEDGCGYEEASVDVM